MMKNIKIKDKDLTKIFEGVLLELDTNKSVNVLTEELTKSDETEIKKMIKDFLNVNRSFDFEKEVEKVVVNKLKNSPELEDKIFDITKKAIVNLYKTFWLKRNFWSGALKNG